MIKLNQLGFKLKNKELIFIKQEFDNEGNKSYINIKDGELTDSINYNPLFEKANFNGKDCYFLFYNKLPFLADREISETIPKVLNKNGIKHAKYIGFKIFKVEDIENLKIQTSELINAQNGINKNISEKSKIMIL